MRSMLSKRRCSEHISTRKVKSRKICPLVEDKVRKSQVKYSAKLNVPLIPRNPQWVLGNIEYLLPYMVLKHKFKALMWPNKSWTLDDNKRAVHALGCMDTNIIRLVTRPGSLAKNKRHLRITGVELCILFHNYGYQLYRLMTSEPSHGNIYFLIKKDSNLKLIKDHLALVDKNTKEVIYI